MEMNSSGWLLVLVLGITAVWAGFLVWSSGVGKRWLQAWGLYGARLFKKPSALVEPPAVHRAHGPGGKAHAPTPQAPHGGVQPHRSGKRRSPKH